MKSWITGMILLLLLVTGVVALAQDGGSNDPATDENANACYEGGSLAGKCGSSDLNHDGVVEDWEVNLMWTCGWYLIRYEHYGIPRDAVPHDCEFLLPPIPEAPAPTGPVCYTNGESSFLYGGPANQFGNTTNFESSDCGESGGDSGFTFDSEGLVVAGSLADAQVICDSLSGGSGTVFNYTSEGFNTPSNYWDCFPGLPG